MSVFVGYGVESSDTTTIKPSEGISILPINSHRIFIALHSTVKKVYSRTSYIVGDLVIPDITELIGFCSTNNVQCIGVAHWKVINYKEKNV